VRGGQEAPTEFSLRADDLSGPCPARGKRCLCRCFLPALLFLEKEKEAKRILLRCEVIPGLRARQQNLFERSSEKESFL
jgi:hypothetical protein